MYKFYYFLCLCPFLCWGELSTLQCAGEEEALFLNRIADFWEEGEYQIAKNQIQEFLSLYPKSAFADSLCSAIGDLFVREKNYPLALDYYAKITDPKIAERIFPHRLQCLYSMQWYAILADECEAYLQSGCENSDEQYQITYYLAVALYHQCLNAANDPETLFQLAKRAEPYFETLLQTSMKSDLSAAFAHLLCILKEFPKAATIYLDLAEGENKDEMLFQAALIQAEYDKELALQTFKTIQKQDMQQEAAYNCLVLSFDLKKYETIIEEKETFLHTIPPHQLGSAHLFFGRSFLALQKYGEACLSFESYLSTEPENSDALKAALVSYVDASMRAKDLDSLNRAIAKMETIYPHDEALVQGKFSKALLLIELNKLSQARQELEELLSQKQTQEILFELIHVNEQMEDSVSCRQGALLYLSLFKDHPYSSLVKQYLANASIEIAKNSPEGKQQLIQDLQNLLAEETNPLWQWNLAKTFFSLHEYNQALSLLCPAREERAGGLLAVSEDPNAYLLAALCYRDGFQDLQNFIYFGEKALSLNNGSIDAGPLHAALYNAYAAMQLFSSAEEHLFSAFQAGEPIDAENILWLADRYINTNKITEGIALLASIQKTDRKEQTLIHLSKLYHQTGQKELAASLLEELMSLYRASPENGWEHKNEAILLLGEVYAAAGKKEEAKELFNLIIQEKSNLRTWVGASASLQSARMQAEKWESQLPFSDDLLFQHVLAQLKDLVLQKNIFHEPVYLEAALDYIDLQSKTPEGQAKKLSLLQKMKRDFENTEDLLSKDYHIARGQEEKQNFIYQSYMQFLDAEILIQQNEQKELQAKAKDLLLKIVEEKAHPALVARAKQCLNQ